MSLFGRAPLLLGAASLVLVGACSDDDGVAPVGPSLTRNDTLDTRVAGATGANPQTRWVYVNLEDPATPLTLTDEQARASAAWDVAFNGFSTAINGGFGKAGSVSVFCVCQNSGTLTGTALVNAVGGLTSSGEATKFEAVSSSSVPADLTLFRPDTLLGIGDWATTANGTRTVQSNVYVLQRPNTQGYAKFQVTAISSTSGAGPGTVTFRYATIGNDRAAYAATQTRTVTVPATGRVKFSLTTGAVTTAADWDVAFEGWRIYTNSGSSAEAATPSNGAYNASLPPVGVTSFETAGTNAISPVSTAYRADGIGVFASRPTWAYDTVNRVALPTYDVYLLKKGSVVYKLQVTGYRRQTPTDPAPVAGFVSFRSARL